MGFDKNIVQETFSVGQQEGFLTDVVLPCLSKAESYKRMAGYFSSSILASLAPGLVGLHESGGKMKLLTSHLLTHRDSAAFLSGDYEKAIEKMVDDFEASILELGGIERAMGMKVVGAMAWLLQHGLLEIAIVAPRNLSDGMSGIEFDLFHPKFGVIRSGEDLVVFSGSLNETQAGWLKNIENVTVFTSWGQNHELCREHERLFDSYWNGEISNRWVVVPFSEAAKRKLIEINPVQEFPDLDTGSLDGQIDGARGYQVSAVKAWEESGRRGILEMATGTGKTRVAKICIERTLKDENTLVVIVAPYRHILDQWEKELFGLNIVNARGPNWRKEIDALSTDLMMGISERPVILAVQNTAASDDFVRLVYAASQYVEKTLLVVDEAHWLGAQSLQDAMVDFADYRLGLSATPVRYFDPEGSQKLLTYFRDVVFTFTLREALDWFEVTQDGTRQSILTPYEYVPLFVELDDEENDGYLSYSRTIARILSDANLDGESKEKLKQARLNRARIVKNAKSKIPAYRELLGKLESTLSHTLVYCDNFEQMTLAKRATLDSGIQSYTEIVGDVSANPTKLLDKSNERAVRLREFGNGNYKVLFATTILDEGVDVPSAETGILLASSGNSKEFIQRRGRLMRRHPGKEKARIYDFVVLPRDELGTKNGLRERELSRVWEFARDALNVDELKMILDREGYEINDD